MKKFFLNFAVPKRGRRKVTLVDSKAQLRLSIPLLTLVLLNLLTAMSICAKTTQIVRQVEASDPKLEVTVSLLRLSSEAFHLAIWGTLLSGIFCFGFWLILSHRIFGPMVPIRRQIQNLGKRKYDSHIVLRKHDEFKGLASDLNALTDVLKNDRGQSLVQVIVAAAIGIIVLLAVILSQMNATKENLGLTESLARSDFQQQLTRSFADGSLCTNLLTQPTPLTFDSSTASPVINLPNTSITTNGTAGAPAIATAGLPVSPITPTLTVASKNPFQITSISGSSSAGLGNFTANFQVNFEEGNLVQAVRPATTQIVLATASVGTMQTVTGCSNGTFGVAPPYKTQVFAGHGTFSFTVPATVQWLNVRLVGAGGGGAGTNGGRYAGGGGGSGGYAEGWISVVPGQIIPLAVGAGGAAEVSTATAGGGTSFGSFISATGGGGGGSGIAVAGAVTSSGGAAGLGSGGQINLYGAGGGDGNPLNPNVQGGTGGASAFGGGGRTSTTAHGASDAVAPGSGGGGGWSANGNASGGNGADGAVFVSW